MQFARDRLKSCEPVRRWRKGGALIRLTSQILTQHRLRAFAIADNARKSVISHAILLGRTLINSKRSTDVRFGSHFRPYVDHRPTPAGSHFSDLASHPAPSLQVRA